MERLDKIIFTYMVYIVYTTVNSLKCTFHVPWRNICRTKMCRFFFFFNPLIHCFFSDAYFKVLWEGLTLNFIFFTRASVTKSFARSRIFSCMGGLKIFRVKTTGCLPHLRWQALLAEIKADRNNYRDGCVVNTICPRSSDPFYIVTC